MRRIAGQEPVRKPGVLVVSSAARKLSLVPTADPRYPAQEAKWDVRGVTPTLARLGKVIHGLNG